MHPYGNRDSDQCDLMRIIDQAHRSTTQISNITLLKHNGRLIGGLKNMRDVILIYHIAISHHNHTKE